MDDWTKEKHLSERIMQEEKLALYFYTPLCGTCQLAGKMLDIVEQAAKQFTYAKANLNYVPKMAEIYQIESVPCLLLFEKGNLKEKVYAFHSVPHLFEKLSSHLI
ncbi:thiol reductase thioredoxin [Weizmannia acidilactici]|uniref:Thiol reductase thioredoxin n=1 Tax=Weizmannia acidilactici TaxID=2607726 RepID=A0A5J4JNH8_9BACI|nr:thioredoxin family protein [Weizmannia acidilactici]GER68197.1 thiol reductase thioredoxin [Weizmannia acidilactici]GER70544.1 thiol reductase thioredoxin [Weizmannia acidilactici]GER73168.1 thiol reductase thioredoxin [Weizmannia acidilactici]